MISVDASFKWNDKTKRLLEQASEKILKQIARQTLDYTGSSKVVANSTGASYTLPAGHSSGKTEQSMYSHGVEGDFKKGFYIGNFTDYAAYVYPKKGVNWSNPNTKTKWFEYIWERQGKGIIENAIRSNKL